MSEIWPRFLTPTIGLEALWCRNGAVYRISKTTNMGASRL